MSGPVTSEVPVEVQRTEKAFVAPSHNPYEAERREQALVIAFKEHLESKGHQVSRLKILPPGEAKPLFSDLYDSTTGTLVEAKGTVERSAIRMAIGQLADDRRFVEQETDHLAVLVPSEPREDLMALLGGEGIEVMPVEGGFAATAVGMLA